MSSPDEDMAANAGLHDSFAGLQWTKQYISRFGGDPERITAAGQSAGGGIITLMLTAYGGAGELPFSQVTSVIKYVSALDSNITKTRRWCSLRI